MEQIETSSKFQIKENNPIISIKYVEIVLHIIWKEEYCLLNFQLYDIITQDCLPRLHIFYKIFSGLPGDTEQKYNEKYYMVVSFKRTLPHTVGHANVSVTERLY
jgi:hypothetical protein